MCVSLIDFFVVAFQLDTWFGRPKKSGRGGGVRSGSGNHTMPRPHSGDDFNEIEQQRIIIERMDEETVNDKFEEMLVSKTRYFYARCSKTLFNSTHFLPG